jgi:hypothetical protein
MCMSSHCSSSTRSCDQEHAAAQAFSKLSKEGEADTPASELNGTAHKLTSTPAIPAKGTQRVLRTSQVIFHGSSRNTASTEECQYRFQRVVSVGRHGWRCSYGCSNRVHAHAEVTTATRVPKSNQHLLCFSRGCVLHTTRITHKCDVRIRACRTEHARDYNTSSITSGGKHGWGGR